MKRCVDCENVRRLESVDRLPPLGLRSYRPGEGTPWACVDETGHHLIALSTWHLENEAERCPDYRRREDGPAREPDDR